MVLALILLALAMIAGGTYAVIDGYAIIVLERGWALVIAGSVVATGGVLLLGLALVASRLARTGAALTQLGERLGRSEPSFPEPPPRVDPVAAVASGLLAGGATESAAAGSATQRSAPPRDRMADLDGLAAPLTPAAPGAGPTARPPAAATAGPLTDPAAGLAGGGTAPGLPKEAMAAAGTASAAGAAWVAAVRGQPDETVGAGTDAKRDAETKAIEELFRSRLPAASTAASLPTVPDAVKAPDPERPAEEDAPFASRQPVVPDAAGSHAGGAAPAPDASDVVRGMENPAAAGVDAIAAEAGVGRDGEVTVIGTYNSGGNRYIMYSNGSIDAETPDGVFRFDSLDELKTFIAAGGERPAPE